MPGTSPGTRTALTAPASPSPARPGGCLPGFRPRFRTSRPAREESLSASSAAPCRTESQSATMTVLSRWSRIRPRSKSTSRPSRDRRSLRDRPESSATTETALEQRNRRNDPPVASEPGSRPAAAKCVACLPAFASTGPPVAPVSAMCRRKAARGCAKNIVPELLPFPQLLVAGNALCGLLPSHWSARLRDEDAKGRRLLFPVVLKAGGRREAGQGLRLGTSSQGRCRKARRFGHTSGQSTGLREYGRLSGTFKPRVTAQTISSPSVKPSRSAII